MKWFMYAWFVLVVPCAVIAQRDTSITYPYADSLLRLVESARNDSIKAERLLQLSFFWSDRDTTQALRYISQARVAMGTKRSTYQEGLLLHYTANVIYTNDIARAKLYYMQADRFFSESRSRAALTYRSRLWNNYGSLLQIQDSANRFMDIIISKALPFARMAGDSVAVGNHLQNIGLILSNIGDFMTAELYYQRAIYAISRFPDAHEDKLTAYVNGAKNAIMASNLTTASDYIEKAGRELSYIPHSTYAPFYYRTAGIYHRKRKDKGAALRNFEQGIVAAKSLLNDFALRDLNFEIYATHRDFGDYATARKYLLIADTYATGTAAANLLLHQREMADTEYHLGNYKAAFDQMKSYALGKDTLQEADVELKVLDLEKKYQNIEKQNEILRLRDTNRAQQSAIDGNRLWNGLLVSGFVIAIIIAGFSWKLVQTNRNALVQKDQLHQQELANLKQLERLNQFQSIMEGQEAERNRIARDLHDGLGGLLAGVKLRLSSIAARSSMKMDAVSPDITAVITQLDHSVDELRRIARNMMPEALLLMGLSSALADLCKYMDTPATTVRFQHYDLRPAYSHPLLIGVYRIVQELLSNAIRHAHATQIIVQCSESDNILFVAVEDDGCGFEPSTLKSGGLGLRNIENRVALLHGRIETITARNQGTTVNIEIPVSV